MSQYATQPTPARPPESLEDLRRILESARRDEGPIRLGNRGIAVLEEMLACPEEVTLGSIAGIAGHHGVSPSTLSRLARRLGFDGFKGFQRVFRLAVAQGRHFYTEQAQRLLESTQAPGASADGGHSAGMMAATRELENLADTAAALEPGTLTEISDAVLQARRLYVLGLRGCYSVAHYLGYYLAFTGKPVTTLGGSGFTVAEEISDIGEGDVLIAVTVRPETRLAIDACALAAERGATVVTVTNHFASPARTHGDFNLHARCEGPYYFNPVAALFMVAEGLLAELAASLGEALIEPLGRREAAFEALNIE
ncbi:MurR/RpiR family transcriptional regulator [Arhodomonas sp. SL1]|uniref:MurR/RpiR family transcriptional regulator n=1 Tax=Arhodomonas sp. SL1 TaxID=3425691 RepID=UPI003F8831C9